MRMYIPRHEWKQTSNIKTRSSMGIKLEDRILTWVIYDEQACDAIRQPIAFMNRPTFDVWILNLARIRCSFSAASRLRCLCWLNMHSISGRLIYIPNSPSLTTYTCTLQHPTNATQLLQNGVPHGSNQCIGNITICVTVQLVSSFSK